jgi:hypothetical protein
MKSFVRAEHLVLVAALAMAHCTTSTREAGTGGGTPPPGGGGAGIGDVTGGTGGIPVAGTGGPVGGGTGGVVAGSSGQTGGVGGSAGITGGISGGGVSGGGAGVSGPPPVTTSLAPTTRNPAYASLSVPLAEPLPPATPGEWSYLDIPGAVSRDGSPAGFYYKFSATGDKRLLVYLVGGGACQDNFFCTNNPPNKSVSLTAEAYLAGAGNLLGPSPTPQDPNQPMFQSGVFKNDPANPVKDWNMVFIPYVSGDLYAGDRIDATVPGYTPLDGKPMQFQGRPNMIKFVGRIVPTFQDAPVVLVTGSSAGGIGALLSAPLFVDTFIDNTTVPGGMRIFFVDDAGPVFDDQFTPICLQQRYRDLYGLNDTLPRDCAGCFNPDGGGLVKGYLEYLIDKYPDNLLGGLIDSDNDEIMQLFFVTGYNNCDPTINPAISFPISMADVAWASRFRNGLLDLVQNKMQRMSSYIWTGIYHQNLFMPAFEDRFYKVNPGTNMTIAEWLTRLLNGEELHEGLQ